MNFDNDEEALELINRLLERLHQLENERMKKSENEKSFVINIYERGSQHIDTQINVGDQQPLPNPGLTPNPRPTPAPGLTPYPPLRLARGDAYGGKGGEKPEVLSTEAAMALWKKVQDAGYVDDNFQPLISRTRSALLADAMAERLGIREKWKVFERLWNRKNMYRDYYKALNLQQSLAFQDEIKKLFR